MNQLYSALFLDYDNVKTELEREGGATSDRFSGQPGKWLEAVRSLVPSYDTEGEMRNIVVRRCYASPHKLGKNRGDFTRQGFEVVDCPPLTQKLKNSADIYMVMDIIEYTQRYPRISEYIILSADADFTPLLTRLRKELKQSVIFAGYQTASAYKNCSDRQINPSFFSDALEVAAAPERPSEQQAKSAPASAKKGTGKPADQSLASQVEDEILRFVTARNGICSLSAVASQLPKKFATQLGSDWAGSKSYTKFMRSLPLQKLAVDWEAQVIRIPNFKLNLAGWSPQDREALEEFLQDVYKLHSVPLFKPEQYTSILESYAAYCEGDSVNMIGLGAAIEKGCSDNGFAISPSEIRYVTIGTVDQGIDIMSRPPVRDLARALRLHVFDGCGEPAWMVQDGDAEHLVYWIRAADEEDDAVAEFIATASAQVAEISQHVEPSQS